MYSDEEMSDGEEMSDEMSGDETDDEEGCMVGLFNAQGDEEAAASLRRLVEMLEAKGRRERSRRIIYNALLTIKANMVYLLPEERAVLMSDEAMERALAVFAPSSDEASYELSTSD